MKLEDAHGSLQLRPHNFLIFQNPTEYPPLMLKHSSKKKEIDWGLLGLQPGGNMVKEALGCFPLDCK